MLVQSRGINRVQRANFFSKNWFVSLKEGAVSRGGTTPRVFRRSWTYAVLTWPERRKCKGSRMLDGFFLW